MSDPTTSIITTKGEILSTPTTAATHHRRKTREAFWTQGTIFFWIQVRRAPLITTVVYLSVIALFSSLFPFIAWNPALHGFLLASAVFITLILCGLRFTDSPKPGEPSMANDPRSCIALHLLVTISLTFISVAFLHNRIIIPGIITAILTMFDTSALSGAFQRWLKEEANTTD